MRWDLAFIASFNFQNYNYAEFCRNRYQPLYRSTRSSVLLRIQAGFGRGEEWKENQSLDMVHISTTPMFELRRQSEEFVANVVFPNGAKAGDIIDFAFTFDLKGTESLFFNPSRDGNTTVAISSSYPHQSFQGAMLPNTREVKDDGFNATWSVSSFNNSSYDDMGVKFVDPANPYQQSMRSAEEYSVIKQVSNFLSIAHSHASSS